MLTREAAEALDKENVEVDLDELINYISRLFDFIEEKEQGNNPSMPKAATDHWPGSKTLLKLREVLSEGINVFKDVCPDAKTIAQDFLRGMGSAHMATTGLLAVANILERYEKISDNKKACLSLLKEMNKLAGHVKELQKLHALKKGMEASMRETIVLIVEASMACCTQIDSTKFSGFFSTIVDGVVLAEFQKQLTETYTLMQRETETLMQRETETLMQREYINQINMRRQKRGQLLYPQYPEDSVGIEDSLKEVIERLEMGSNKNADKNAVAVILHGFGGMGKTTLADAVFARLLNARIEGYKYSYVRLFDDITSVPDVVKLQRCILTDLMMREESEIPEIRRYEEGQRVIEQMLEKEAAFIYIDNVLLPDRVEQGRDALRQLLPRNMGKARKLRLLLTARDKDAVRVSGVKPEFYPIKSLPQEEALDLFTKTLDDDSEKQLDRSQLNQVVKICGGVPNLLKVVAGFISSEGNAQQAYNTVLAENKINWKGEIGKDMECYIFAYENLEETLKDIFLDLCFFFQGWDWEALSNIVGEAELKMLEKRSLVTKDVKSMTARVHDVILAIGLDKKGERFRFTRASEFQKFLDLKEEKDLEKIKGIWSSDDSHLPDIPASKLDLMHRSLRVVILGNSTVVEGKCKEIFEELVIFGARVSDLPFDVSKLKEFKKLSHLCCKSEDLENLSQMPSKIRHIDFELKSTAFQISSSCIQQLSNLRVLRLRDAQLKILPQDLQELGKLGNDLQELVLSNCEYLEELPVSISTLGSLKVLRIDCCSGLTQLPEDFGSLSSLQELHLRECGSLEVLPSSLGNLASLQELHLNWCVSLEALHSVEKLSSLRLLDLSSCESITNLPHGLEKLPSLVELSLRFCWELNCIPKSIGQFKLLDSLDLSHTKVNELPDEFCNLSFITKLEMNGCRYLEKLPDRFGEVTSLRKLSLVDCNSLKELPKSFNHLNYLEHLNLSKCETLEELCIYFKGLSSLRVLSLGDCKMLKNLPEDFHCLASLEVLDVRNCYKLEGKWIDSILKMKTLEIVNITGSTLLEGRWGEIPRQGYHSTLTVYTGQRNVYATGTKSARSKDINFELGSSSSHNVLDDIGSSLNRTFSSIPTESDHAKDIREAAGAVPIEKIDADISALSNYTSQLLNFIMIKTEKELEKKGKEKMKKKKKNQKDKKNKRRKRENNLSQPKLATDSWSPSKNFLKLTDALSEAINAAKDFASSDAKTIARGILKDMGTAHVVNIGFLVVANALERYVEMSDNQKACLSLLEEMNKLAQLVRKLQKRHKTKEGMEASIWDATALIVEASIVCCTQIEASKAGRFWSTTVSGEKLTKLEKQLQQMHTRLQNQMQLLTLRTVRQPKRYNPEYPKDAVGTKKPVQLPVYPQHAVGIEDPLNLPEKEALNLFMNELDINGKQLDSSQIQRIVNICGGVPALLKVFAGFINEPGKTLQNFDKLIKESKAKNWIGGEYGHYIEKYVFAFDILEDKLKDPFLDICSFFRGWDWKELSDIVGQTVLEKLEKRALVTLDVKTMTARVHDVILEVGLKKTEGERFRLTNATEIEEFSHKDQEELQKIKGIWASDNKDPLHIPAKKLDLMSGSLRVLKLGPLSTVVEGKCEKKFNELVFFSATISHLPFDVSKLKWFENLAHLCYHPEDLKNLSQMPSSLRHIEFKLKSPSFHISSKCIQRLRQLRVLRLSNAQFESLPEELGDLGKEYLGNGHLHKDNLEELSLSCCQYLKDLPATISGLRSLRVLRMASCSGLTQLPEDLSSLNSLQELYLYGCKSLETLPSCENLTALQKLDLPWCESLKALPSHLEKLTSLQELHLYSCRSLEALPRSLEELSSLRLLDLSHCYRIKDLPCGLEKLTSLVELDLYCCGLSSIPGSIGKLKLNSVNLHSTSLKGLPDGFCNFSTLTELDMSSCELIEELPERFGEVTSLRKLKLPYCRSLKKLPESFNQLKYLENLDLSNCSNLEELCKDFKGLSGLRVLSLEGCNNLKKLPEDLHRLTSLEVLDVRNCYKLEGKWIDNTVKMETLQILRIRGSKLLEERWEEIQAQKCDQPWSCAVYTEQGLSNEENLLQQFQSKFDSMLTNGEGNPLNISDLPLKTLLLVMFDGRQDFDLDFPLPLLEENIDDIQTNFQMVYFGNHWDHLPQKVVNRILGHAPANWEAKELFKKLLLLVEHFRTDFDWQVTDSFQMSAEIVSGKKGDKYLSRWKFFGVGCGAAVEDFVVTKCGRYLKLKQLAERHLGSPIALLRELLAGGEEEISLSFLKKGAATKVGVDELQGKTILLDIRPANVCRDIPLQSLVEMYDVEKERFNFEIITVPIMQKSTKLDVSDKFSREVPWLVVQNPWQLTNATKYFLVEGCPRSHQQWDRWYPNIVRIIKRDGTMAAYNYPGVLRMVNAWGAAAYPFTAAKAEELIQKEKTEMEALSPAMFLFQHLESVSEQLRKATGQQKMICLCCCDEKEFTNSMKDVLTELSDIIYIIYISNFTGAEERREFVYFTATIYEWYSTLEASKMSSAEMRRMFSLSLSEHEAMRFWARMYFLKEVINSWDQTQLSKMLSTMTGIYDHYSFMFIMNEDGNLITTHGKEIIKLLSEKYLDDGRVKELMQQLLKGNEKGCQETFLELEEMLYIDGEDSEGDPEESDGEDSEGDHEESDGEYSEGDLEESDDADTGGDLEEFDGEDSEGDLEESDDADSGGDLEGSDVAESKGNLLEELFSDDVDRGGDDVFHENASLN